VIVAGLIWGLYNVGFAVVFSFGPSMLFERGWSIAVAGSTISIALWLAIISVPAGGYLADRTGLNSLNHSRRLIQSSKLQHGPAGRR